MGDRTDGTDPTVGDPDEISPTTGGEMDPGEAQEDLDAQTLKAKLDQAEAYISELKGNYGNLVQRFDNTASQLVELQGRVGEQRDILARRDQQPEKPVSNPWELDPSKREEFQNSPDKIVDFLRERDADKDRKIDTLVGQIAGLLKERDGYMEQKFEALTGRVRAVDPEVAQWKGAIEELRKDQELADLPEEKLIAIAKRTNMKPAYEYSGGPAQRVPPSAKPKAEDRDTVYQRFMQITGDEKRATKLTDGYMKGRGA
jgi:DNA repair exonuclease SbcCD ATPase subunit